MCKKAIFIQLKLQSFEASTIVFKALEHLSKKKHFVNSQFTSNGGLANVLANGQAIAVDGQVKQDCTK